LKSDNLILKKIVLNKFINSGINISPTILKIILKVDEPMKLADEIIRDSSFVPNFQSHLTKKILTKISSNSLEKSLVRTTLTKELSILDKKESNEEKRKVINTTSNRNLGKIASVKENSYENQKSMNSKNSSVIAQVPLIDQEPSKIPKYEQIKVISSESTKSTFQFKPKAKNYSSNLEIVRDPTGKLYTNGEYSDFHELTQSKFRKLKNLITRRPDVFYANNIINIIRLTQKNEVSAVGMVNSLRKTKRDNYFLNLEDLTGNINVLIKKDSENREVVKLIERTVIDQMLCVNGTYVPGEKGNSGLIYAHNIFKIDVPYEHIHNHSPEPLSIAFISDTHIGSKEFEENFFKRFIEFLNGKIGNKKYREIAGRVKYIVVNGDLIDGIGIYPAQKKDLLILDIYRQFEKATELLSEIPDYIEIIYSTGNHEPVRNAIPRPAVPPKYSEELRNIGISCVGNPAMVKTHGVDTLVFHGDSMLDMNMTVPGLENSKPVETMKEFLKCRHLAPIYGKKTQIAPVSKDWLVIDTVPDIFHTGHLHINGMGQYRNVSLVNSGCFQTQTDFMKSFGILPTPGIVPIIELDSLNGYEIDFKSLS
jgi:DNA polymerase II small subunit